MSGKKPDTKKSHYVPQFYLKKFASTDERLYAFNKFTKKSFKTTVRDVASEMRFYDFHPDIRKQFQDRVTNDLVGHVEPAMLVKALDNQVIEHELAEIEKHYASVFEEFLEAIHGGKRLTQMQRLYIADLV